MASALDKYPQIGFAESGSQPIPKKNKKYSYFDDGKIKPSRHSFMKILDVVPFNKASWELHDYWAEIKKEAPQVFKEETDYFIIGYEMPDGTDETFYTLYTTLFARAKNGGWYGFRTDNPETWWTGQLVTNPHFNYDEFVEECNRG